MHYLYRYVCILNVFFICVYGQMSAIKNLLLLFKHINIFLLKNIKLPHFHNNYAIL